MPAPATISWRSWRIATADVPPSSPANSPWPIGAQTYADAVLDRLVHNAHRLDLTGESPSRTPSPRPKVLSSWRRGHAAALAQRDRVAHMATAQQKKNRFKLRFQIDHAALDRTSRPGRLAAGRDQIGRVGDFVGIRTPRIMSEHNLVLAGAPSCRAAR